MRKYILIITYFVHTLCFAQQQVYDKIQSLLGDGKYEECELFMLDNRDTIIAKYGKLIYDMNLVISVYSQFAFSHDTLKLVQNRDVADSFWEGIRNYDVHFNGADLWPLVNMTADYFNCLNDEKCLDVYDYAKFYQNGDTRNDSIFLEIQEKVYDYHLKKKDYENAEKTCQAMIDSLKSYKDLSDSLPIAYHRMGKVLQLERDYTKAQYYYELSWQKQFEFSDQGYYRDYAVLIRDLAAFYSESGSGEKWYYFANKYCKINNAPEKDSLYIASLIDLCKSELYINKIDSASNHLDMANQILNKKPGLSRLRNLSHMMTNLLDIKYHGKKSFRYVIEEPDIFDKDYSQYIAELAIFDEDYNTAIDIMTSMKKNYEKAESFSTNEYVDICSQLSIAYSTIGKIADAEKILLSAEEFINGKGITTTLTRKLYYSHGILRFNLKDYDQAIDYLNKAKCLYEISNDKGTTYAEILSSISTIYLEKDDYLFSKLYLEEAVDFLLENNTIQESSLTALNLKQNLAYLFNALGNKNEAKRLWEELLSNKDNKNFSSVYSLAANNYGFLCFKDQEFKEAKKYFEEALDLCNNDNNKETFLQNLIAAKYFIKGEDVEDDLLSYNQLVNNNIASVFTNFTEAEREEYWNYQANTVVALNNLLAFKSQNKDVLISAYDINIHAKTMMLNSSRVVKEFATQSNNTNIAEKYDKYLFYKTLLSDKNTHKDSINEIKEHINKIEKEILFNIPDLASKINGKCANYEIIKESLKDGEFALEFTTLDKPDSMMSTWDCYYIVYLVRKNDDAPRVVLICNEDSLYTITDRSGLEYETLVNNLYKKGNLDLYNLIWKNIERFVPYGTRVFFAPTGILNTINFNAIPCNDGRLGDYYELVEVSTTGKIPDLNCEKRDNYSNAIVYGDINYDTEVEEMKERSAVYRSSSPGQLPVNRAMNTRGKWGRLYGTAIEIYAVDSILKAHDVKTQILKRDEANEESFKALNNNSPSILHVATHGFYLSNPLMSEKKIPFGNASLTKKDQPLLYSGLLFSGANKAWLNNFRLDNIEDGVLTAEEISRLELTKTKIAVMSACETGLGAIDNIDGVFGLQRGLKKAGVKSIVMSLWTVPDNATCLLMKYFYNNLFSGQKRHTALKNAQKQVKSVYEEPYYWAGFVIID